MKDKVMYSERISRLKKQLEILNLKIYNNFYGLEFLSERQKTNILADIHAIEEEIRKCFIKQYPEKDVNEISKMLVIELTR